MLWWWWQRRPMAAGTEPTCAQCGYVVLGLQSGNCPECGSDLAQPGAVVPPGKHKPLSVAQRLVLLALIVPLPAVIAGEFLAHTIGPWNVSADRDRVIFLQSPECFATIRATQ